MKTHLEKSGYLVLDPKSPLLNRRHLQMAAARLAGKTLAQVGEAEGVGKERVRQICVVVSNRIRRYLQITTRSTTTTEKEDVS